MSIKILDCTLRDGGYYNAWNFPTKIVDEYLVAMKEAGVSIVEIGLRSLINDGFKGANAYSTDLYLSELNIPNELTICVMVNASELIKEEFTPFEVLEKLFPQKSNESLVKMVRIACHFHEVSKILSSTNWLKEKGYDVGVNIMQIADRSEEEIENLSFQAIQYPIDVLYFADSMGSLSPKETSSIIKSLKKYWKKELGIHTHDNMGLALSNTIQAIKDEVTWLDSTVTGMGRGPGNSRTEELAIEVSDLLSKKINLLPLMRIIEKYFQPMKNKYGWGTNPYYYLAGKYGIHPTYIQEMLNDSRYSAEDIFAAINNLKQEGGKKFNATKLGSTRLFYTKNTEGAWKSSQLFEKRDVLILGAGNGVFEHQSAIENYIRIKNPIVVALNTQSSIHQNLIDVRVACHPVRLLADCSTYKNLPQPLIIPFSILPKNITQELLSKEIYDFGLEINQNNEFTFFDNKAILPNSLVISYALAVISSGKANRILLAGFDGYGSDDPRTKEIQQVLSIYENSQGSLSIRSITPTAYAVKTISVYGLLGEE